MSKEKTSKIFVKRSHASSDVLIDVDNVKVQFGKELVLHDVNLCLHSGEFVGLIGPNGAGKTTLLRIILGIQSTNEGKVSRNDTVIGYIPQKGYWRDTMVPMNVTEIVQLGSRGNKSQANQALEEVGMSRYSSSRFANLSGGQQQKVLIAKALAGSPNVLILDEPTTGIDESSQGEFFNTLKKLHQKGITILMVSHDVDTVLSLVSRVICLNQSVVYDGPSQHFETDKFLPKLYGQQHRILHHQHEGIHD